MSKSIDSIAPEDSTSESPDGDSGSNRSSALCESSKTNSGSNQSSTLCVNHPTAMWAQTNLPRSAYRPQSQAVQVITISWKKKQECLRLSHTSCSIQPRPVPPIVPSPGLTGPPLLLQSTQLQPIPQSSGQSSGPAGDNLHLPPPAAAPTSRSSPGPF